MVLASLLFLASAAASSTFLFASVWSLGLPGLMPSSKRPRTPASSAEFCCGFFSSSDREGWPCWVWAETRPGRGARAIIAATRIGRIGRSFVLDWIRNAATKL